MRMRWGRRMKRYATASSSIPIRTQVAFSKSSGEETSSEEEEEEEPKFLFRPKFVPKCVFVTRIPPVRS